MSAQQSRFFLVLWTALLCAASAGAQSGPAATEGGALERFEPSAPGDALLATPDMHVRGHLLPKLGLVGSYANGPLVLRNAAGEIGDVVSHQLVLHAMATLPLWARVQIGVDLPLYVSQAGEDPAAISTRFASPEGTNLGDVRTDLRISLLEHDGLVPGAGIEGRAWWPSGSESDYTGAGEPRYGVTAVFGADSERFRYRLALGRRSQPIASRLTTSLGSDTTFGGGAAYRVAPVWLGAELFGSTRASAGTDVLDPDSTPLEALFSARYESGPWRAGIGAGPGLSDAAGTPRYRVVVALAWAPGADVEPSRFSKSRPAADSDGSGQTPVAGREARKRASDRDRDGVLDETDRCPDQYGEVKEPPERLGCPPDRDADGISDMDDRCPDVPGVASVEPAKHGCPADRDGDGIFDEDDACPTERGKKTEDPKTHGCPDAVRVEGTQIVILEQVNFATGSDQIEASSFALLAAVASAMNEHPEIVRVAVDGHTDNVGNAEKNMDLSRRRALSVLRWLVEHQVDERRLEARGFGPRRPIADNTTGAGKAKNRRVEFQILKRSDKR
nr:OmpA family protein [Polyangiaceae bacterium]